MRWNRSLWNLKWINWEYLPAFSEKLKNLEEEQSKKSSSNKNNDPKTARNDAIKKLLIKNLKLAAMIASKEIELEEAKGKGLACE